MVGAIGKTGCFAVLLTFVGLSCFCLLRLEGGCGAIQKVRRVCVGSSRQTVLRPSPCAKQRRATYTEVHIYIPQMDSTSTPCKYVIHIDSARFLCLSLFRMITYW